VLLDAVAGVRLGQCAVGVEQHGPVVTVRFADGSAVTADVVIGADGVHSTIREMLFGAMPACFSGLVAYRGIVAADRIPDVPLISAKWWGRDRHLVHYWVSGGRELNFVAPVPEATWTEETWTAEGGLGDLLDALSDFAAPVRRIAAAATTLMRSALYDRDPLPRWGEGRVTLLGDACHPMLPFMAQGAGMAIEDAVVLARCLDGVQGDGVEEALSRYAATRMGRTSAVQGGSRANDFLRGASSGLSAEDVYSYDAWHVPLGT
jgi:salicylate hydroxylase